MKIITKDIKFLLFKARKIGINNKTDLFITFILLVGVFATLTNFLNWIFFHANWEVVSRNLNLYIIGTYPKALSWRPFLWISIIILLSFTTLLKKLNYIKKRFIYICWLLIIPLGIYLLAGGINIIPISTNFWGGLSLTLILTFISIIIALPIGILLALGRQSNLLIIKKITSLYIDCMRSVPLIAILFFGQLLTPLLLPVGMEINRVIRAIFSFSIFVSAYISEDIRGGLQSVPQNQIEAAKVLGLNKYQINKFIVLPQALIIAIPALTNQAIGLLQNTSLMAILGLVELLGISRSILANPQFIGSHLEVYVWLALIYWLVCTIIALLAKKIERHFSKSLNFQGDL